MVSVTIDCEEWNAPFLRGIKDRDTNNTSFSKEGNTALLQLFRKHNIKATFFITGYYAEREPEDVRRIAAEGHEIACHGYEHFYRRRAFEIEKDVRKGKAVLEKISGLKVLGFRAPQAQYSPQLLSVLDKAGFRYDSSLHPAFLPGYYNHSNLPMHIHRPAQLSIIEIPVGVMPFCRLPIVWMFMRNIGVWWTQLGVNSLYRKNINPTIYVHSWEFRKIENKNVPFYFRRRTGRVFLKMLEDFIVRNKKKGRTFSRLCDTI